MNLERYGRDPVGFIDRFVTRNEKGLSWRLSAYQRRVLALAFTWSPAGDMALRLLLWGEPKKSGKTFVAGLLALWWAFTNASTEIIIAANDAEQAASRVFRTMVALLRHNPALGASATIRAVEIGFSNGTLVTAIASEYKSAAGSRHSLFVLDEPWGITSERAERLVEELTPPPTEANAWGLLTTTAGFVEESALLERVYQRGLTGTRLDAELEVYRADDLTMFWAHTPRQVWQTGEAGARYYAEQRRLLRPNTYLRLHENRWTSAESAFVTAEMYDACVEPGWAPLDPTPEPALYVGVDASVKKDTTAVVAVLRDPVDDLVVLATHCVWTPTPGRPIDFAAVEAYLVALTAGYQVAAIAADPYQLVAVMQRLQAQGVPIREFVQTEDKLTRIGQGLYDLIHARRLVTYPSDEVRAHVLAASAKETPHGFRIVKTMATKKIDACVALAMAAYLATTTPAWEEPRLISLGG